MSVPAAVSARLSLTDFARVHIALRRLRRENPHAELTVSSALRLLLRVGLQAFAGGAR